MYVKPGASLDAHKVMNSPNVVGQLSRGVTQRVASAFTRTPVVTSTVDAERNPVPNQDGSSTSRLSSSSNFDKQGRNRGDEKCQKLADLYRAAIRRTPDIEMASLRAYIVPTSATEKVSVSTQYRALDQAQNSFVYGMGGEVMLNSLVASLQTSGNDTEFIRMARYDLGIQGRLLNSHLLRELYGASQRCLREGGGEMVARGISPCRDFLARVIEDHVDEDVSRWAMNAMIEHRPGWVMELDATGKAGIVLRDPDRVMDSNAAPTPLATGLKRGHGDDDDEDAATEPPSAKLRVHSTSFPANAIQCFRRDGWALASSQKPWGISFLAQNDPLALSTLVSMSIALPTDQVQPTQATPLPMPVAPDAPHSSRLPTSLLWMHGFDGDQAASPEVPPNLSPVPQPLAQDTRSGALISPISESLDLGFMDAAWWGELQQDRLLSNAPIDLSSPQDGGDPMFAFYPRTPSP